MASTATSTGGAEEEDDDDDDDEEEEMTAAAAPAATSVECRRPRNWSPADVMAPRPLRVGTLKCGERDTGFAASSNSLLMDMQLFCVGFDRLSAVSLPGWERKE